MKNFNPRSPHGERPFARPLITPLRYHFNPRSPHGERPSACSLSIRARNFNPRSPHGERPRHRRNVIRCTVYFNPRSPHGERLPPPARKIRIMAHFNPRSPHGERLAVDGKKYATGEDFNPRSPHGERRCMQGWACPRRYFNPRSPHGERQFDLPLPNGRSYDFNPRSPHGERRFHQQDFHVRVGISIHAPRTGSDLGGLDCFHLLLCISIHAPRTGSDEKSCRYPEWGWQFQSTLPARGATSPEAHCPCCRPHFNPRSPHGERRTFELVAGSSGGISIHAPRTGSDQSSCGIVLRQQIFQSTLPARGATHCQQKQYLRTDNFNPRSPHGERRNQTV